jgi:RNA polymerase sigma factor (sigma-70 family)
MLIEDSEIRARLSRMIWRLTPDFALRADLMQEALIRLWQIQIKEPAQSRSWYLQNCRFHLLHYLTSGRSVDSPKRRASQVCPSEEEEQGNDWMDQFESESTLLQEIEVRDILALLAKVLSPREMSILHWMAEGLGTREIARQLNISHPMVIKHRRKIASLAFSIVGDFMVHQTSVKSKALETKALPLPFASVQL